MSPPPPLRWARWRHSSESGQRLVDESLLARVGADRGETVPESLFVNIEWLIHGEWRAAGKPDDAAFYGARWFGQAALREVLDDLEQEPAVEPTAAARTAAAAPTAAPAAAPSRKRARTAATARTEPPSAAPRRAAAPRGAPAPAPAPVVPALPDELMFCSRCDRRMGGLRTATHSGCGADEAWCTCD